MVAQLTQAAFHPELPDGAAKTATMDFCWGGGVSFRYATLQPKLDAAVAFYGAPPDTSALASIRAPVLGLYGGDDARVNGHDPEAEMTRLGKIYGQEIHDCAGHAFLQRQTERDGKNRNATESGSGGGRSHQYDVSSGGERFVINTVVATAGAPITLILNWQPPSTTP